LVNYYDKYTEMHGQQNIKKSDIEVSAITLTEKLYLKIPRTYLNITLRCKQRNNSSIR